MTLEEAVERVEIVAQATLYFRPEVTEAMEAVAKVARAFPKMLEALENLVGNKKTAGTMAMVDDNAEGRIRVTGRCVRDALDALRAAREAVKP